jgi:hypothetical protein
MSFAIITNVVGVKNDAGVNVRFCSGLKTIKKILLVPEEAGDIFDEQKEAVVFTNEPSLELTQQEPKEEESKEEPKKEERKESPEETELLAFIREQHGDIGFDMANLVDGQYFLMKSGDKYLLNVVVSSSGWFTKSYTSSVVGKYYTMPMVENYDVASPKVAELKTLLASTLSEKSNLLAQSCSFQSQASSLDVENKFLKSIIEKFHKEIETLNNKHEEAKAETINRINSLETKMLSTPEPRITRELYQQDREVYQKDNFFNREFHREVKPRKNTNNDIVGKFENSLALIANFDKSKLRSLANSTAGF